MNVSRWFQVCATLVFVAASLSAKDQPSQVVVWPESGTPVLRFTFGKFKEVSAMGNRHTYMVDTTAENLWNKKISHAAFAVYLSDKSKVRIADAWITVNDVGPGQAVKFQTTFDASGAPATLQIVATTMPEGLGPPPKPRLISITVNSVPQGASIKVDGNEAGTTPKVIEVGVGKHILEFSKQGFNTGHFPMEISGNDVSGGSVSYELGTSAYDTIELRDGSVLTGDVESMSATEVVVRLAGALQHLNRNQVKRIALVERDSPTQ